MTAQQEDDTGWVLDSVVGFLKGPVWNIPILAYIEQQSVVFEPEDDESVSGELEQEYRKLFDEYKKLVDRLLAGHMDDLCISAEQFDEAIKAADGQLTSKLRQALFEQIWAADDYSFFVRMMKERNIQLQLQALEVLAHRYGLVFDSFLPATNMLDENNALEMALKKSLEDIEEESSNSGMPDKDQIFAQKAVLEAEMQRHQNDFNFAISHHADDRSEEADWVPVTPKKEGEVVDKSKKEVVKERSVEPKRTTTSLPTARTPSVDVDEVRKRAEYLRRQRDKLLAAKRKEREKQLSKMGEELSTKRPKSAKAVRSALAANDSDSEDEAKLAFRKSLAARLKSEVVDNSKS